MLTTFRHLLAILLLPFFVVVVVPYLLLNSFATNDTRWNDSLPMIWLPHLAAGGILVPGLILFGWCVSLFVSIGRGTLAPWDPTQTLVAVGPYRYVRNPMISGVALILIGQALFQGSWLIGLWSCVFVFINHIYFVYSEEPGLEKRFGESYRGYKAKVPRWVPRIRL